MEKIELTDYELLKQNKVEIIIKKYMPMIIKLSYEGYIKIANNSSISFEDILQKNLILIWKLIGKLRKKLFKKEIRKDLPLGLFFKRVILSYNKASANKQSNKIDMEIESLDAPMKQTKYTYGDSTTYMDAFLTFPNFENKIETKELYQKFSSQLTKKEKEFIVYLEMYGASPTKIHKATKISLQICNTLKKKLRKDFDQFIEKQNYQWN